MTYRTEKVNRAAQWTESTWSEITDHVAKTFRMTEEERAGLEATKPLKILSAIPFLAGCDQPMRTALANAAVYMMSVGHSKSVFSAAASDDNDVFERLKLARFEGGNPQIVDRGMALIALNMLSDYRRDTIFDIANQKHNPIATGAWDYASLEEQLLHTIESIDCPQMDEIATVPQIMNAKWFAGMFPSWF